MNVTNLIDVGTRGLNGTEPKNNLIEKNTSQGKSNGGFESVLAAESKSPISNDDVKTIINDDNILVENKKIVMDDLVKVGGQANEGLTLKDLLGSNIQVDVVTPLDDSNLKEKDLIDPKKVILTSLLELKENKTVAQNSEELLQNNELGIAVDDSLFKQKVLEALKQVADKSIGQKDNEKVTKNDILNLVNQVHEVVGLLVEVQKLLGNQNNVAEKVEDIKSRLNLIADTQIPEIIKQNADFSLKDFSMQVSDMKNKIADLIEKSATDSVLKPKFHEVLTKLNNMEDAIVKIKQSDSVSNAEVEIIQLIKKDVLKDDTSDSTNENNKLNIGNSENNTEEAEVNKEGTSDIIPKNDVNLNIDKTTKSGKTIELNFEQLKEKVNDKINLIEKMTVSKDKLLISLNPRNMGDVELFFKKTSEGVELTVEFNEKHTKHKLEAMFDDMKKDLKEKNIDLNFIFKEKEKNNEENSERKKEYMPEERMLENENEPEQTFQEVMKRVLRGE